jgi:hypothetical protein
VGDSKVRCQFYHSSVASGTKSPTAAADSDSRIIICDLSVILTALFHNMCIVLAVIALSSEAAARVASAASTSHLFEEWWDRLFRILANLDQRASMLSIFHGVNKSDSKTFLALSCCSSDSCGYNGNHGRVFFPTCECKTPIHSGSRN